MTRSKRKAHHWYMRKSAPRTNKQNVRAPFGTAGGPKWCPEGPLGSRNGDQKGSWRQRWCQDGAVEPQRGATGNFSHHFVRPRGPKATQGGPTGGPRGAQRGAKGSQRSSKGAVWTPFWATRLPFEIHCFIVITGTFRAGEGRQGEPNDGQRGLRRRHWYIGRWKN